MTTSFVSDPDARRRSPLLITLLIFGAVVVTWVIFSNVWTDWLWFSNLGYGVVFTTLLATKVGMFAIFGVLMAAAVAFNMWLAFRIRPKVRGDLTSPVVARLRDLLDFRRRLVIGVPAALIGFLAGMSAVASTESFMMWRNATPFGVTDPYFGIDVSFYMFGYPWWRFVAGFLIAMLLVSTIAAGVIHFMTGALTGVSWRRPPSKALGHEAAAQRQLSVLVGLGLVVFGLNTLLDRVGLSVTNNRLFTGIANTDANARVPALLIMAIIAFICAALFFANAWLLRWSVPAVSVVLMIVSSIILSGIYPWAIQTFQVTPSGSSLERPYIAKNIEATRQAFGVDHIKVEDYKATTTVSSGQLKEDAEALPAIRLMDPAVISQTFEQLQQVRGYYVFPKNLDVDRYEVDGQAYDTVVAARELSLDTVPDAENWANKHTVYTHGFGMVAAYGNKRQSNGEPVFLAGGIPTVGILPETEPRIYFGERTDHYVIVGAPEGRDPVELDTPGGGEGRTETRYTYTGSGGVPIGNYFTRMLYATRMADINMLLSDRVNSDSQIMYDRVPAVRAQQVAPWLTFDQDAYPSVVNGRLVWILDAYTTSNTYPNSTSVRWDQAISDARTTPDPRVPVLGQSVNYVRNSVKAVVDAYDGTVKLYGWDEDDPILKTWKKVYPGVILPKSEIDADLLAHLRYPQDMFKVQRQVLGRYHTGNVDTWYQQSDIWEVPNDPVNQGKAETPYFLTIRWPADDDARYSLTSVFVPRARENLSVYMAVNADATSKHYGQIRALKLSDAEQIDGPGQTFNQINSNSTVAQRLLPFKGQGAQVQAIFGNLLTLPVGGGLLYVQPIYTRTNTTGSYPVLRFVAVRFGQHVGIGDTLQAALDEVFQGDAGAATGEGDPGKVPTPGPGTTPTQPPATPPATEPGATPTATQPGTAPTGEKAAADLVQAANQDLTSADAALRAGDLAEYQRLVNEAKGKLGEALRAMGR